jgi:diguanylate cyclase (GGDEF)-like protein
MKLRAKTLIIIGATLISLLGILYASARWIVLDGFSGIEQKQGRENVENVQVALDNEIARIDSTAGDWAFWDDTYQYVENGNPEYVDANLTDSALATLRVDLISLVTTSGEVIHTKVGDLEPGEDPSFNRRSQDALLASPDLFRFNRPSDGTSGLVSLPEGPMLVAARPVLTSDNEGPVHAALIMGRYLDSQLAEELGNVTGAAVSFHAFGDDSAPGDVSAAASNLAASEVIVSPINRSDLGGYTVMEDVEGEPALTVRVLMPRDVFATGTATAWYLLGALALAGIAFAVTVIVLLERAVLSRLRRLSSQVAAIASANNPAARASLRGGDEVADLAKAINSLLATVERSTIERDRAESGLIQLNRELDSERQRIQSLNRSLEAKVAQRTRDLEIANEQLRQRNRQLVDARTQAATDALTGLGNHRAFHQRIREALRSGNDHLGLVIIDIDDFKTINDSHGHMAGDQVLRDLATALLEMGLAEHAYRYGGDEFAIILKGENQRAVSYTAEQVRLAVQTHLDGTGSVTVSIGAASYPETASTAEELIYGADSAMYWAKSAGKNRVGDWSQTRREETTPARRH